MLLKLYRVIRYKLSNRSWKGRRDYLIKKGAIIGEGTRLNCGIEAFGTEPYLIKCGSDCLFASGVHFLTHDGGIKVLNALDKFKGKRMEKFAPIIIGNNVYIGSNAMIMPGVTIGDNVIIGAGAIVTHDIPSNVVSVGIPAKPIKSIDEYCETATAKGQLYCFEGKTSVEKETLLRTLIQARSELPKEHGLVDVDKV